MLFFSIYQSLVSNNNRQWSHETQGKVSVNLQHDTCKWVQYLASGIHSVSYSISCCRALSPWIKLPRASRWPFTCVIFDVWNARSIGCFACAGVRQSNSSHQAFLHMAYRPIHSVVRTDSN